MAATKGSDILLAHGAWHRPHHYQAFTKALASRGYNLIIPALPSVGEEATGISWSADTKALLELAAPLFSQGKELVLIAHSYGGVPASVATRSNSVEERAQRGLKGGFRQVIFLCAFVMPAAGVSPESTLPGGQMPDWHRVIETDKIKQLFVNEKAIEHLYNDLPTDTCREFYDTLVPQSYAAFSTPVDFAAPDITIAKTYIVCEKDNAIPVFLQHEFGSAPGFDKVSVSGGHSAFASMPDELADVLVRIIRGSG